MAWAKGAGIAGAIAATNANAWLNSAPLSAEAFHGKVVLVYFWTYSCINSLRPLPYVRAWADTYKHAGLVVLGVHTPEFSFEKERENVAIALRDQKVDYPIVMDSDYGIWNAFDNEAWPAFYLIDAAGRIRHRFYGEGEYAEIEHDLQKLLEEDGAGKIRHDVVAVTGEGVQKAPDFGQERSPETYVGANRAEHFVSDGSALALNEWSLHGAWNVGPESAVLEVPHGTIRFRFHSRDLNVVLGLTRDGAPVRYRVTLGGSAPGADCGVDCAAGTGEVREPRLYQLIRQSGAIKDRTFEIEFLDPGVRAYVFTFG
jgi:thiol-disulfide isomerase/thioredoxin